MSQVMSDHTQADPRAPIIELKDAEVVFTTRAGSGLFHKNRITAVNKVNLKLMPGQTIGIVGESGCGKSTTANIMCGLQQVTSGKVFFKGQDVTHRTAKERMAIGRVVSVVFQDPATALNARMSVIDQLIDPLVVHKLGDRKARLNRAEELIHMVGLPSQVLGALHVVITLGDIFILKAYVVHPILFVAYGAFISVVFVTIVYTLVSLFRNVGKALAVILLVLQIAASGGTYPIEVMPEFFQSIHPLLPFKYAIGGLREAVGGVVPELLSRDTIVLAGFFLAFLIIGVLGKKYLNKALDKFSRKLEETLHLNCLVTYNFTFF